MKIIVSGHPTAPVKSAVVIERLGFCLTGQRGLTNPHYSLSRRPNG